MGRAGRCSEFTHFKPNDNRSSDEPLPCSGCVLLQYIFFFSFPLWGFSRALPTWLQETLQFQLWLFILAAVNPPNAYLLLYQPCLDIWGLDMILVLIWHLMFCHRFFKSIQTPQLWVCALQSWWEQLVAPHPENINSERRRSDDLFWLYWFWWLSWEEKALVRLLEEPSTLRISCQCTSLSSLPVLEQRNQSSASCCPWGWELLKIPLLLLNVSSLGGNTAAALCNEWGIDVKCKKNWGGKKKGRTTEQPSEMSMQISYWINRVEEKYMFWPSAEKHVAWFSSWPGVNQNSLSLIQWKWQES